MAERAKPSPKLAVLIDAHRCAQEALNALPEDPPDRKFRSLCRAEERALHAVCAHVPRSKADSLAKAKYLAHDAVDPLLGFKPGHIEALLQSIAGGIKLRAMRGIRG
jgi:hypothetical protein